MKYLPLLIIVTTILIGGCGTTSTVVDYRTGTEGLSLELLGPSEINIYKNSPLPIEIFDITLTNKGAYTLQNNDLYLRVTLPDGFLRPTEDNYEMLNVRAVQGLNGQAANEIYGKSMYSRVGDELLHRVSLVPFPEAVKAKINVDLCYRYVSILSDTLCINTEEQKKGEGCKQSSYSYSGQGGPISISNVEIKEIPVEQGKLQPRLVLTVRNSKGDFVSLPTKFDEGCTAQEEINKAKLIDAKLGSEILKCDIIDNVIDFENNERKMVCYPENELPENGQGYYETPIYIEIDYGYHASETMDVSIKFENI